MIGPLIFRASDASPSTGDPYAAVNLNVTLGPMVCNFLTYSDWLPKMLNCLSVTSWSIDFLLPSSLASYSTYCSTACSSCRWRPIFGPTLGSFDFLLISPPILCPLALARCQTLIPYINDVIPNSEIRVGSKQLLFFCSYWIH